MQRISATASCYDPLHYVLMFPYKTPGWTYSLQAGGLKITLTDYAAFQLALWPRIRRTLLPHSLIVYLFHANFIDLRARIEKERLKWMRFNQKTIRAEIYQGIADALDINDNVQATQIGRRIILAPSFIGGLRSTHV